MDLNLNEIIDEILLELNKNQQVTLNKRIAYARKHGIISKDECDVIYEDPTTFFDIITSKEV